MSKVLINTTTNPILISDTGINLPVGSYTIDPVNYLMWANSNDIVTRIGNGNVIVNDGSSNLSISDGIDLIKGYFPKKIGVLAGDDLTPIGHVTDKLKVIDQDAISILNSIAVGLGVSSASAVFKKNEVAVTSRNEFDLANTTYTVPVGKKFVIGSFTASYDAQAALYVRLKKQTGGVGAWETQFRLNMMSGGQGNSTLSYDLGNGMAIGNAGDIFKITIESSIAKGTIFASYGGGEI